MKTLLSTAKVLAILTFVIGIVHEIMTFHPMIADGLKPLTTEWQQTFTYFSLGCGGLAILCGVLFWMLARDVERHIFLTRSLLVIGIFAAANGLLALGYMFTNPFAWIIAALGVGLLLVSIVIHSKLHQ